MKLIFEVANIMSGLCQRTAGSSLIIFQILVLFGYEEWDHIQIIRTSKLGLLVSKSM